MSVAFRRESDEEHLEPKFERPLPPGPNLVTAAGLAQAGARVSELEAAVAVESDEAELNEARRDLRYWRTRLATATVAPLPDPDEVGFGSRVRFRLRGAEQTLRIVGDDEADPAGGSIAYTAPLARALIGARAGDLADFAGEADAIEVIEVGSISS